MHYLSTVIPRFPVSGFFSVVRQLAAKSFDPVYPILKQGK